MHGNIQIEETGKMNIKNMKINKIWLSITLSLAMVLGIGTLSVYADDPQEANPATATAVVTHGEIVDGTMTVDLTATPVQGYVVTWIMDAGGNTVKGGTATYTITNNGTYYYAVVTASLTTGKIEYNKVIDEVTEFKSNPQPTDADPQPYSANLPIDLLEDNGDGSSFINGPRDVSAGDKQYYETTIGMQQITAVVDSNNGSIGYISGEFTMTMKGTNGLKFSTGSFDTTDIKDYFRGDAVDLFELESVSFDSATNTATFKIKTIDSLKTDGMDGSELSEKLKKGIYGYTGAGKAVTVSDAIAADGYERMVATFNGTLNYHNSDKSRNYLITLTGVQDSTEGLKDTTLGKYGSDPDSTVSATVLYKAQPTVAPTSVPTSVPTSAPTVAPTSVPTSEPTSVPTSTPSSTTVTEKADTWCVTFLDCKGDTVSVQWVKQGENAIAPVGFGTYADYTNVTSHRDLRPTSCSTNNKWVVPNTSDK